MIFPLPTLYKRDTNGNIRELTVEYSQGVLNATRTIAGIKDGNLVTIVGKMLQVRTQAKQMLLQMLNKHRKKLRQCGIRK